jgi:hypoxanthine phosphoribosyltransferase
MMRLAPEPLLRAEQIAARVGELAQAVRADFEGKDALMLAVLKGGAIFAADLLRALQLPMALDYIRVRSYDGDTSSGTVRLLARPELSLRQRHVLVVEDILDTGRSSARILRYVRGAGAAQVRLCVLLDKPERRVVPVHADYVGFTIPNCFVVGYGLDYCEQYRHLTGIYVLDAPTA